MMIKRRQALRQRVNLLFIGTLLCSMGCGARTGLEVSDTSAPTDGGEGGSDSTPCPTTFADCHNSGHCQTDLNESSENCGACGNVCPDGLVCGAGVCRHPADIIQVAAGYAYSCALRASGQVLCWGANDSGVLGDGSFESHDTPMQVIGLHDAVEIEANTAALDNAAMCARRATGALVCWGAGDGGMLGNGSDDDQPLPVAVAGVAQAASVKAAKEAACSLLRDGAVWCWGINSSGQSGDGTSGPWMPEPVVNLDHAVQLDIAMLNCVTLPTGEVACWGQDQFGWAGQGETLLQTPTIMKNVTDADSVHLPGPGSNQQPGAQCVIFAGGRVSCTGANEFGNIDIDIADDLVDGEMKTIDGITDAVQVVGTLGTTCALRANGEVLCWGTNGNGEMGTGSFEQPVQKVVTVSGLEGVVHLAGGRWHMCAALGSGGVACWGGNQAGQLGDGTLENRAAPVHVLDLP